MPSSAWTDERLNDQEAKVQTLSEDIARIGPAVESLTEEMRALRQTFMDEGRSIRDALGAETRALHQDLSGVQGRLTIIGFGLVGSVFAAAVAIILAVS